MRAYKTTVDFWAEDFKMKPLVAVDVKEVSAAGPVTQDDNVKVFAIIVEHPPVKPALGYRFDFKDRSIAFSGDTAPFEAVAKMAKGADVLVHEAMYVPALETYIRGEIAKGRPVKSEDSDGAHEGRSHAGRGCRPYRAGGGGQDPRTVASGPGHRRHHGRYVAVVRGEVFQGRDHRRKRFDGCVRWPWGAHVA